jgi:hypothetical protein
LWASYASFLARAGRVLRHRAEHGPGNTTRATDYAHASPATTPPHYTRQMRVFSAERSALLALAQLTWDRKTWPLQCREGGEW